jgi:hypothetical protein
MHLPTSQIQLEPRDSRKLSTSTSGKLVQIVKHVKYLWQSSKRNERVSLTLDTMIKWKFINSQWEKQCKFFVYEWLIQNMFSFSSGDAREPLIN